MKYNEFRRYCKVFTKIENYECAKADNFKGWACHHRLELNLDGSFANSKEDLIRLGMYYNRPYFELVFMKDNEHRRLHGLNLSDKTKEKYKQRKGKILSEFGMKFKEHFGFSRSDNINLYQKENCYYNRHNKKCRWEAN